jgi:hypothetical protein
MKQHVFKHALTHDTQANNCRFDSHHSFPWNATSEMASLYKPLQAIFSIIVKTRNIPAAQLQRI